MRLSSASMLPALGVIHTAIWAIALSLFPFAWTPAQVLAQFLSTFVLVVMSLNLVLATRARPLEGMFGGLDKVFTSHRSFGAFAGIAILGHVAIIPITTRFVPGRLVGLLTFALIETAIFVAVAPRAPWRRLVRLPYHHWKIGHRFMGLLLAAGVAHSLLVPTIVRFLPLVRIYVYGFAAAGILAYVYRQTVFRIVARRHAYRVAEARHVGDAVLEIHLDPVRAPISHRAGQFAFVAFDGGPTRERHPFTLSAAPVGGPLRFSIKASGDYTRALQNHLEEGSSVSIEGPYGLFDYRTGRPRQLWLAGGIGITPYLAFLPTVDPAFDVTLVWTVHDEAEAVYRNEIEAAIADKPNVRAIIWPSDEKGHLTLAALRLERPEELSYYLCGPIAMRRAFAAQLKAAGVRRADMHWEEFTLR